MYLIYKLYLQAFWYQNITIDSCQTLFILSQYRKQNIF